MSITAFFDHVPAMTSFDRWIEETYGNTPIISNVDENNNQTIVTQNETSNKTPVALPVTNNVRKRKLNDEPTIEKYLELEKDVMGS